MYLKDGNDLIVAATKGGAPTNPDWYYNVKAHPRVTVEVGTDVGIKVFPVQAVDVTGHERDRLYGHLAQQRPAFADYATRTHRVIPMLRLIRVP